MIKMMVTVLALPCILIGCSKENKIDQSEIFKSKITIVKKFQTTENLSSVIGWQNNKAFVTLVTATAAQPNPPYLNQYLCGWGQGLTFGPSLPHDITPDPYGYHDGELIPDIGFVGITGYPAVVGITNGAYFSIIVPSMAFPSAMQMIQKYHNEVLTYWRDTTGTVPRPNLLSSSTGTTTGSGPALIEVRGMLVRDHASPTKMSVTDDKYKPITILD